MAKRFFFLQEIGGKTTNIKRQYSIRPVGQEKEQDHSEAFLHFLQTLNDKQRNVSCIMAIVLSSCFVIRSTV